MGKRMAGTNEFAFSAVEAYVPGGGSRIRPKQVSKNAFRPVPVPKSTFPELFSQEHLGRVSCQQPSCIPLKDTARTLVRPSTDEVASRG